MKKIQKIITGIVVAGVLCISGNTAYAQSIDAQLRSQMIQIITQLIADLQVQIAERLANEEVTNISNDAEKEEFDVTKTDRYPAQQSDTLETSAETISVSGDDNDYAEFEIDFHLNAFGNDSYLSQYAADAIEFSLTDDTGTVVYDSDGATQNGTIVVSLSSDADLESNLYRIDEDTSEEFTLNLTYSPHSGTPAGVGAYRLQMDAINYVTSIGGTQQIYNTSNLTKFRTASAIIVD